jgi:hypothetical protein
MKTSSETAKARRQAAASNTFQATDVPSPLG